jgi:2-isopropylmalate synthase
MNLTEKIEVAKQLERLKVDVIEAGFAIASPGDFSAVKAVAETIKDCTVASLSRAVEKDIDSAYDAVKGAVSPRIHTFLATSPIHMKYKLSMEPDAVIERIAAMVAYAKKKCSDVQFSAEDATRSDKDFLVKAVDAAIRAGATVINIPDTVGYTTPEEMFTLIKYLKDHVQNIDKVDLAVHCHNDLGMAVANSLAGIRAGATQLEGTVNGIGERAANKAIVGANAFAHEAGIHQHGVLAERSTYEIMTPESIGLPKNKMVLGKHSGRHAFEERLNYLGYQLSNEEMEQAFVRFKDFADKKKNVFDSDIDAIVAEKAVPVVEKYHLDSFVVQSGNHIRATATIQLSTDDATYQEAATGEGPIEAAYHAIEKITGKVYPLEQYSINAISGGEDALGEVVVKIKHQGHEITGRGLSTDVIEASLLAYLNGINKISANHF